MASMIRAISAGCVVGIAFLGIQFLTGGFPSVWKLTQGTQERSRQAPSKPKVDPQKIRNDHAKLPLAFVENRGQTDARVRYYAQGPKFIFYLKNDGVVLRFTKPSTDAPAGTSGQYTRAAAKPTKPAPESASILGLRFLGSNPEVLVAGEAVAPGKISSFRGSDPIQFQTPISRYSQVIYCELWPGIDLRLREQKGTLKYEFRLQPGARVSDIRLEYTGANRIQLETSGELLIHTPIGVLRDSPPVSYQEVNGGRTPVASRYALSRKSYGFATGSYDQSQELIIDPGLDYTAYLGGITQSANVR